MALKSKVKLDGGFGESCHSYRSKGCWHFGDFLTCADLHEPQRPKINLWHEIQRNRSDVLSWHTSSSYKSMKMILIEIYLHWLHATTSHVNSLKLNLKPGYTCRQRVTSLFYRAGLQMPEIHTRHGFLCEKFIKKVIKTDFLFLLSCHQVRGRYPNELYICPTNKSIKFFLPSVIFPGHRYFAAKNGWKSSWQTIQLLPQRQSQGHMWLEGAQQLEYHEPWCFHEHLLQKLFSESAANVRVKAQNRGGNSSDCSQMLLWMPDDTENCSAKTAQSPNCTLRHTAPHDEAHSIYNAAQLLIYNSPRPHSAISKAYFLCILLCPTS